MTYLTNGSAHRVVKVSRGDRLLNGNNIIRVRVPLNDHLHTLTQPRELIPNIPRATKTLELQKLLVTKLLRVVRVGPLFPYVEKRKMISSRAHKVLSCLIRMQLLILRSVENGTRFRQHSYDSKYLSSIVAGMSVWRRHNSVRVCDSPRQYTNSSHSR